ncbi:MAG: PQQ-dependent sugar dehydrogenase [Oleiphilus sp.]
MPWYILFSLPLLVITLISCDSNSQSTPRIIEDTNNTSIMTESFGQFNEPWAMTFLPDGRLLITEKPGVLVLFDTDTGAKTFIDGVPDVVYAGQGGLGDVILHPNFADNNWIYFSYAERNNAGKQGAAVARAKLQLPATQPTLENIEVIWRQSPFLNGSGHYSHRLAFGPDGYLFITSGDRQEQTPAQDWDKNLGKIIRLHEDGSVPVDNPFQDKGELAKSFWTLGHRNLLGITFDASGNLWSHEMGPKDGDEFNLIKAGDNYGWPIVSWGDQYSGFPIPDHDTRPEFHAPETYWVPTIAPSGLIIYSGTLFPGWQGDAFIGGLKSQALIRVDITGLQAREAERFDMKNRIREVEQDKEGAIWVLQDGGDAQLLRLTPQQ